MKLEYTNMFNEKKTSSGGHILPCGQTERIDVPNNRLPNFTNATKKKLVEVNKEIKKINECRCARQMSEEKQVPRINTKCSVDQQ